MIVDYLHWLLALPFTLPKTIKYYLVPGRDCFSVLPPELISRIFFELDPADVVSCRQACSRFVSASRNAHVWEEVTTRVLQKHDPSPILRLEELSLADREHTLSKSSRIYSILNKYPQPKAQRTYQKPDLTIEGDFSDIHDVKLFPGGQFLLGIGDYHFRLWELPVSCRRRPDDSEAGEAKPKTACLIAITSMFQSRSKTFTSFKRTFDDRTVLQLNALTEDSIEIFHVGFGPAAARRFIHPLWRIKLPDVLLGLMRSGTSMNGRFLWWSFREPVAMNNGPAVLVEHSFAVFDLMSRGWRNIKLADCTAQYISNEPEPQFLGDTLVISKGYKILLFPLPPPILSSTLPESELTHGTEILGVDDTELLATEPWSRIHIIGENFVALTALAPPQPSSSSQRSENHYNTFLFQSHFDASSGPRLTKRANLPEGLKIQSLHDGSHSSVCTPTFLRAMWPEFGEVISMAHVSLNDDASSEATIPRSTIQSKRFGNGSQCLAAQSSDVISGRYVRLMQAGEQPKIVWVVFTGSAKEIQIFDWDARGESIVTGKPEYTVSIERF
ncbi:hypothetical protein DL96DRAFT_1824733 [Flagelloscypha sp. PMI_526]|nr:hypothetical protein DL96DRAFT_1824733 [Flagelloscypha sp. PMI_526]